MIEPGQEGRREPACRIVKNAGIHEQTILELLEKQLVDGTKPGADNPIDDGVNVGLIDPDRLVRPSGQPQ